MPTKSSMVNIGKTGKAAPSAALSTVQAIPNSKTLLGIPTEIAYLLDELFESIPNGSAKELPRRFVNAIQPGADLSMVIPQFLLWMLSDPKVGVITDAVEFDTKALVTAVIALFDEWVRTGTRPTEESVVARAARAARAAWAAWDAWNQAAADKLIELLAAAPAAVVSV